MPNTTWFIDGNLYRLPNGTLVRARWQHVNDDDAPSLWQFENILSGESEIEVHPSGLITQAEPQETGALLLSTVLLVRSDLTISDIQPA
jgi:hypothetical protein